MSYKHKCKILNIYEKKHGRKSLTSKGRQRILKFETKSTIYITKKWRRMTSARSLYRNFQHLFPPRNINLNNCPCTKIPSQEFRIRVPEWSTEKIYIYIEEGRKTVSHYLSPFPKRGQPSMERNTLRYLYTFNRINGGKKRTKKVRTPNAGENAEKLDHS